MHHMHTYLHIMPWKKSSVREGVSHGPAARRGTAVPYHQLHLSAIECASWEPDCTTTGTWQNNGNIISTAVDYLTLSFLALRNDLSPGCIRTVWGSRTSRLSKQVSSIQHPTSKPAALKTSTSIHHNAFEAATY